MFGKYALLRPFARGGMGEICLAAHGELGGLEKLCLVKKVLDVDDQPSLTNRLLDEAKVAVRLNHANLVQVFDAGKVDEELYIAMELIEGRDLRAVWNRTAERRARIPLDVALFVVREMARGLDYAHNYGGLHLVHRDIAPPNILLSWHGEVKITDFGLARSTLKSEKTAPGIVYGRIAYLAPEQARGEQADARTDLYAVGVILWELLTGRPLHETTDEPVKNLEKARHPRVELPSRFSRGIAPTLDAVVMKALAPKREERYQSADDLRKALSEELGRAAPTTDASRLSAWLSEQFDEEVKTEGIERERLLREELPVLRARHTFEIAALAQKPQVVRAQSLDLRIAGVDREPTPNNEHGHPYERISADKHTPVSPTSMATVSERGRAVRDTDSGPHARVPQLPAKSGPIKRAPALPFDDEVETRVQSAAGSLRPTPRNADSGKARSGAMPARAVAPDPSGALEVEALVGQVVDGRYQIERLLGTGGMGAVYEAEHIEIGKKVALKVLHPQFSRQADLVARFRREARAASKVGHPNIVDVTDSGTTGDGDAYFVMERLDGTDLADVLRQDRKLAVDRALAIGTQICRALHAAHNAGIIHRDLKPENIFLVARDGQPDFVKVLDFGIAKSDNQAQGPRRLTTPGIAMGTPEYMAPEQAAGKPIDGRVDIYSVGAILYEVLCGEPPHAGTSVMDILAKKATQAPEPLRSRAKNVSETLERVVMSCLERDPNLRPQTMAALEYELTKFGKGRGSAVAAVLGIKPSDDGGWDEPSRTSTFEGGFGGPTVLSTPRGMNALVTPGTLPGVAPPPAGQLPSMTGLAELLEPATGDSLRAPISSAADGAANVLLPAAPHRPSALTRVLGILGGLAFLGGGGYFAYSYQAKKTAAHAAGSKSTGGTGTNPKTQTPDVAPDVAGGSHTKQTADAPGGDEQLSDAEIARMLEWARRTAEGGRIIAPPGDNLKELLDRIEKASPGNAAAVELRGKAAGALARRGTLALKKSRLEEAEDSFRALIALKSDDEWAKGRLSRTLSLRADRSLEKRRYKAAIADANASLELAPDDVLSRMVLAEAHLAGGNRELAVEEFGRVLELRPKDKRAQRGLAMASQPPAKRGKPAKKKR